MRNFLLPLTFEENLAYISGSSFSSDFLSRVTVVSGLPYFIHFSGNSFWKAFSSNTSLRLLFHVASILTSPVSVSV